MNIYHRAYNPKMETIQGVTARVDKLQQGWALSKVVAVSDYDYVAVFEMRESPAQSEPEIKKVGILCPVVLDCNSCPVKKHGACAGSIITGVKMDG